MRTMMTLGRRGITFEYLVPETPVFLAARGEERLEIVSIAKMWPMWARDRCVSHQTCISGKVDHNNPSTGTSCRCKVVVPHSKRRLNEKELIRYTEPHVECQYKVIIIFLELKTVNLDSCDVITASQLMIGGLMR
jgi:hypothetical protein